MTVNVGLAVGLSIAAFLLCIVGPTIICIVICCVLGVCASSSTRRTRVVAHTAPTVGIPQTTVVSTNSSNVMQVSLLYTVGSVLYCKMSDRMLSFFKFFCDVFLKRQNRI